MTWRGRRGRCARFDAHWTRRRIREYEDEAGEEERRGMTSMGAAEDAEEGWRVWRIADCTVATVRYSTVRKRWLHSAKLLRK